MKTKILTIGFTLLLSLSLSPSSARAVNFYLEPEATTVNIGEIFSVDIGFNNDGGVLLNGVVMTFSYDQDYLELQDTDDGNMSGTGSGPDGTNIMDANHFSGWNTDLDMISNRQENYTSSHPYAIHYEVMHSSNTARDGIFGRAFFKALKSTSSPANLVFGSYYGQDQALYIDPDYNEVEVTGNMGASVDVVPEPGSLVLLMSGLGGIFAFIGRKIKGNK